MSTENEYKYLRPKPGSLYRQLFVNGRIRADIIYSLTIPKEDEEDGKEPGRTPEQIAEEYRLPLEAVLEAIDYCQKHWDVVVGDHRREEMSMEASGMNHPEYKYNPKKYYKPLSIEDYNRIFRDEDLPR